MKIAPFDWPGSSFAGLGVYFDGKGEIVVIYKSQSIAFTKTLWEHHLII
jgi:hypothetical protein